MNRSDLRTRILEGLNESASSPVFWSNAQVHTAIQDGMELLSEEAEAIKRTVFFTNKPNQLYYATRGIAEDVLAPYRIWLHTSDRRLSATTVGQLDAYHETWDTVTGEPEYWFPMGWDWFGLWPYQAAGGALLRMDYLAWPRALDDDEDRPEFPEGDHNALVIYGVYEGLLKRWDVEQATMMYTRFLRMLGQAQATSGVRQLQARTWQPEKAPGVGFRTGEPTRFS